MPRSVARGADDAASGFRRTDDLAGVLAFRCCAGAGSLAWGAALPTWNGCEGRAVSAGRALENDLRSGVLSAASGAAAERADLRGDLQRRAVRPVPCGRL